MPRYRVGEGSSLVRGTQVLRAGEEFEAERDEGIEQQLRAGYIVEVKRTVRRGGKKAETAEKKAPEKRK